MDEKIRNIEINLSDIPTCRLVDELKKRLGVKEIYADPYEDISVNVNGHATILVVID